MPMTRVDGSVFLFLIRYQQRISVDIFLYIISQCHKKKHKNTASTTGGK